MLGKNIYKLRKEKNMSQEELAEAVGVARQTISNWELGETFPNPEQLKTLSKILNISIDELLNNDIKDVLINKVSNTEILAGMIIKILKFIGIGFIVLLVVEIIILILFNVFKFDTLLKNEKTEVTLNCNIDDKNYLIKVDTDNNYSCNNCSDIMNEDVKKLIDYSNIDSSVENIEKYFKNNNGLCE